VTNDFYLVNAIFQSIPSIGTNSPLATIIPLAFVVGLGMVRELVVDLKRWREDKKTNRRKYTRVANGQGMKNLEEIRSDQIRVGDIIELYDD
jgi:hypothetical protein